MRRTFFSLAVAAIAALAPALAVASDSEDKAAAEQVAEILRDSGQMQNYSVGVKYKKGTVWLTGRVANKQQMQTALQILSDVEGIDQIVNNMTVGGASGAAKAAKPSARRVSATSADMDGAGPEMPADGDATPAGFHRLSNKHAPQRPMAAYAPGMGGPAPAAYDQPHMPNYAWPSYAAHPNYAAVTYPKQYSPTAFPFIGPFYPYPQVPLGWRKVSLEWDDGWWFLDFYDRGGH